MQYLKYFRQFMDSQEQGRDNYKVSTEHLSALEQIDLFDFLHKYDIKFRFDDKEDRLMIFNVNEIEEGVKTELHGKLTKLNVLLDTRYS